MSVPQPGRRERETPRYRPGPGAQSSLLGGLLGIGAVALATVALGAAGGLIALIVTVLF